MGKAMVATAPTAAPDETPIIDGLAIGFRKKPCMTVPAAGAATASIGTQDATVQDTTTLGAQADDSDCEYPLEVEDDTGETVVIEEEPEEIVVLAPNLAQHVWELDAEEKVTGMPVTQYTAYLEGSEDRENVVGEFGFANTEAVVELEPDLVLAGNINADGTQALRDANQTVYQYPLASGLADLTGLVERTGELVGACEAADDVTAEMRQQVTLVENATADVEVRPEVFYDLGDEPSGPFTVNENAFEHDVLTTAGTENIAADLDAPSGYLEVSPEFVIEQNPEYVVTPQSLSEFPGYDETDALANDRVIEINANLISQHAPRAIDVLAALAEEFHPEEMQEEREARSDDGDDGTIDDESDEDDEIVSSPDDEEDSDDDGIGFTGDAAVAALLALTGLLARRRQD